MSVYSHFTQTSVGGVFCDVIGRHLNKHLLDFSYLIFSNLNLPLHIMRLLVCMNVNHNYSDTFRSNIQTWFLHF